MRKIFIFGIGDKSKIKNLVKKLEAYGFSVEIGPTAIEHDILGNNSDYYRISHTNREGAFCSDVGRIYKLSKSAGMYMDVSCEVGPEIIDFYDNMMKNNVALFRETPSLIANCILFSGTDNSDFYKELLKVYLRKIKDVHSMRFLPIGPFILTNFVSEIAPFQASFDKKIIVKSKGQDIVVYDILEIRNQKAIMKHGFGSWGLSSNNSERAKLNIEHAKSHGAKLESNGKQKIDSNSSYNRFQLKIMKNRSDLPIWISSIRDAYDSSTSKDEIKKLKILYKKIDYKIRVRDWLIGSILFRVIKMKSAK